MYRIPEPRWLTPRTPRLRGSSLHALGASLVFLVLAGCASTRPQLAATLTPEQRRLNLESFDTVWETVRDSHWDPQLGGVDWPAVRDELRPRLEDAASMASARAVIGEMLARLGQSHYAIIPAAVHEEVSGDGDVKEAATGPPDVATPVAEDESAGEGVTGLAIRVYDRSALVAAVDESLPAASAGVRPGWQILEVGGRPVAPLIDRIAAEFGGTTMLEAESSRAVERLLGGPVGTTADVRFLDGADRAVSLSLARAVPAGTPAQVGHLPTLYLNFRSRRTGGEIGYIAFNVFIDPAGLMASFADALRLFMDAPGIIIDLRGNPGGLGAMAMGIGSWFVREPDQRLGTMLTRETALNFVLNPRLETYGGPLAILIDGCSMSTSEILAGGLQDLGRARIFGTPSAGAALPSVFVRLPNGDGFQYAIANYVSVGGEPLEGRGVTPDVLVVPDRASLLAGNDPVVDAAVAWIRAEAAARTPASGDSARP